MFWTKDDELIARAAAEGWLRCEECNLPVTFADPFNRGQVVWLDTQRWVTEGVPHVRCRSHTC